METPKKRKGKRPADYGEIIRIGGDSKTFWRLKMNVDIDIFYHKTKNCIEIVAFHPDTNSEAPRIYVDYDIVASKITEDQIEMKLSVVKEQRIRARSALTSEEVLVERQKILYGLIYAYLLSRINVSVANGGGWSLKLTPQLSDKVVRELLEYEYEFKPNSVVEKTVKHKRKSK